MQILQTILLTKTIAANLHKSHVCYLTFTSFNGKKITISFKYQCLTVL